MNSKLYASPIRKETATQNMETIMDTDMQTPIRSNRNEITNNPGSGSDTKIHMPSLIMPELDKQKKRYHYPNGNGNGHANGNGNGMMNIMNRTRGVNIHTNTIPNSQSDDDNADNANAGFLGVRKRIATGAELERENSMIQSILRPVPEHAHSPQH